MTFKYTFISAFKSIRINRSRSILTILGIVIGVAAIILIASLGKGAQDLILDQVQGLGSRTIAILPGRTPTGPSDVTELFSDSLKEKDLVAIEKKSNVPTMDAVMPIVFGADTAFYQNQAYRLSIYGISPEINPILDLKLAEGNFLSDEDVRSSASVTVIGSKVKDELFGQGDALNQKIKIKNRNYRIVGVLSAMGQSSILSFDEAALVPYTTAQQYILGIKYFQRIIVEADSTADIARTASDLTATLRESHGITDPSKDDFSVQTQADLAQKIGTITNVLTFFLAAVAGISLFVAGIGIMNIMLVSVTERTREIGLRKALGATQKDILRQFLFESIALTVTGGIAGIIIGATFSFAAAFVLNHYAHFNWTYAFPFTAAIIGVVVSILVGLIFGIYPARQASEKNPIEALQYE